MDAGQPAPSIYLESPVKQIHDAMQGERLTLRLGTLRTLSGYFFTYFFLPLLE